jgi:hypothetical protein
MAATKYLDSSASIAAKLVHLRIIDEMPELSPSIGRSDVLIDQVLDYVGYSSARKMVGLKGVLSITLSLVACAYVSSSIALERLKVAKGDAAMARYTSKRITLCLARLVKLALFAALAIGLVPIGLTASFAQTRPLDPALVVPTTKLLAIGTFTDKATPSLSKPVLPSEVRQTMLLYLDGKIDQWFVKQDQSGVVFLMNLTDPKEAHDLLEKLPLGQAGLMEFEIIPLGPISPLRMLISEPAK